MKGCERITQLSDRFLPLITPAKLATLDRREEDKVLLRVPMFCDKQAVHQRTDRQAVDVLRGSLRGKLSCSASQQGTHTKVCQRKMIFLSFMAHKITFYLWRGGERLFISNTASPEARCIYFWLPSISISTVKFDSPLNYPCYQLVCNMHPPEQISEPTNSSLSAFWWQHLVILLYHLTTNIFVLKY